MKKIILLLSALVVMSTLCAQKKKEKYYNYNIVPKYTISVQPTYLASSGLRLDFEKQLGSTMQWLQLSATGYYAPKYDHIGYNDGWLTFNTNYDEPIQSLKGGGIGAAYKSFFKSQNYFYYSVGLYYTHYSVDVKIYDYHKFIDDGLTYYKYEGKIEDLNYDKINTNLNIGMQTRLDQTIFIDFYMGVGYSYSFRNSDYFSDNMFEYGYRGMQVVGGFRIGFAFGKSSATVSE